MADPDRLILANIIADGVERTPDLDVLTFVTVTRGSDFSDEIRTYQDLWNNGQRMAQGLIEAGMAEGEAFAIIMQNHPEFVDLMVASSIANSIFVPIDPRTRGEKLKYMLTFTGCRGVVIADYAAPALAQVIGDVKGLDWVWVLETGEGDVSGLGEFKSLREILARPVPNIAPRATDPAHPMQMLFTSGTTGDPKAILAPYARFGAISSLGPALGLRPDDRPYTGLSLTHANAQIITLGNILKMGLRGVIGRRFTKSRLWDITRHYGCTVFNLLGGMINAIYSEPVKPDDADNPVRYVLSAGMPAAIWEDFARRFDVEIYEFYGCAEGGLTLNPPGAGPVGSIGKPPPGLICKIFDEDDNEVAPGEKGQICFKNADGSDIEVVYFKNPEASAEKTRGGWFRSGDIGHKDEDGWVYFDYRAGSGIRRNGDFVNIPFVEKAIAEEETVDDVFVYGVHTPDNAPGEKEIVAAIVPTDPDSFDAAALFDYCRRVLEANFVPSFLHIVDKIPKTASEKPQERFLLEDFERGGAGIVRIS